MASLRGFRFICVALLFVAALGSVDKEERSCDGDFDDGVIQEIQSNIEALIDEGFTRADTMLNSKTADEASKMVETTHHAMMIFHFRSATKTAKHLYRCIGLGMLETSKLIVERYGIKKEKVSDVLQKIAIPDSIRKRLENQCSSEEFSFRQSCDATTPYRKIDGTCNNLNSPTAGAALFPYRRHLTPAYEDGVNSPRGNGRVTNILPNPRVVSVALGNALTPTASDAHSQMVKAWGQFIDHDMVRTPESTGIYGDAGSFPCCRNGLVEGTFTDCLPIDVSTDSFYDPLGVDCLRFARSLPTTLNLGHREQINQVTAYIDASNVYGSSAAEELKLREFSGGRLKTNPLKEDGTCVSGETCPLAFLPANPSNANEFIAGDIRVNEQPGLGTMHTVFVRYHNKIATALSSSGSWTDETLYQETRRIVSAVMQHITYNEFLPVVLGKKVIDEYELNLLSAGYFTGYDPQINATHNNVFAAAAFRFGHTLIGNNLRGQSGTLLPLKENFFNSPVLKTSPFFPSHIAKGECDLPSERADFSLVLTLRNFLFAKGPSFSHGSDLMALNIMRGRDHGIPDYNQWREFCGLRKVTNLADLAKSGEMSSEAVSTFQSLYPNVDEIDLFPAALAEKPSGEGSVTSLLGPTFSCILAKEFRNLKFGDRFWYETGATGIAFTDKQLKVIRQVSLAGIICDTTSLEELQKDVFLISNNSKVWCSRMRDAFLTDPSVMRNWQNGNPGVGRGKPRGAK